MDTSFINQNNEAMKFFYVLSFLFITSFISAQDFQVLVSDPAGDPTINGIADIRTVSYAVEESMDSLWFKVEFYNSIGGDMGMVFGVDTNLVVDDGFEWNSNNNTSLKPDVIFTVNRNFIDPTIIYGSSSIPLNHESREGDNDSTIIVNMPLSNLDSDGIFNLLIGAGGFSVDVNNRNVYEDAPDAGFITVDISTAIPTIYSPKHSLKILSNPTQDYCQLVFEASGTKRLQVYNANGQLFQELVIRENSYSLDCREWSTGVYFLVSPEQKFASRPLVKL